MSCLFAMQTFISDDQFRSHTRLESLKRMVRSWTTRSTTYLTLEQLLRHLNPMVRGWTTYFRYDAAKRTFAYGTRVHTTVECTYCGVENGNGRILVWTVATRRRMARCRDPVPGVVADGNAIVHGSSEERVEFAFGSTTNSSTAKQVLLQRRESAGCFTHPSRKKFVLVPGVADARESGFG